MFEALAGRSPGILGGDPPRQYAVLAPYLPETGELLFEVRAQSLNRQPGEICFPGGRLEPGESPIQAAVRETVEELLVAESVITPIAPLDVLLRPEDTVVHPFLAELRDYRGSFQTQEVAEVFAVPFSYFLEHPPEVHHNTLTQIPEEPDEVQRLLGLESYRWSHSRHAVYYYRYGERMIWGMTARFVLNLVELFCGADK